jgi:DNA-directed RNA polymerase subunit beta'
MKFFSKKMLQKWSFSSFTPSGSLGISGAGLTKKGSKVIEIDRPFGSVPSVINLPQLQPNRNAPSSISPNQVIDSANFIQIGLASSDEIQNWAERSYFIGQQFVEIGEVKRPDTLNYRTFKPEKDGLFCERIFGPVNDWTCACGQIKEQRFALDHERALLGKLKPKVCANCQVEVTSSRLRRYRMGYISLACPVTHIWYLNSRPSLFSILLKMPTKYIKKIAYYKAYSPSSSQREYMSSCLGPGGDFFDNEWEFLHSWLSGKHSIEDIPSRTTKMLQGKASEPEGRSPGPLAPGVGTSSQYQVAEASGSSLALKPPTPAGAGGSVGRLKISNFGLNSFEEQNEGVEPWRVGTKSSTFEQSSNDPVAKNSTISSVNKQTSFLEERNSSVLYLKMPESPEWLANTGAQALLNHLNSRDWQKESEKLEFELQSTPSLNEENAESGFKDSLIGREDWANPDQIEKSDQDILSRTDSIPQSGQSHNFTEKETDFLLKRRKSRVRTLKLLKSFQKSGLPFTGMIFHSLPVLPPELRPIIQLGAGQLASSDVNDLYRRILSRNNRLKYYLYETHFVEFLVRSEQQLVQLAVDALLENGKTTSVRHTSGQKRLYKSLSDRIGGKQGRFRMNLLGKRVDYSGRSVIVVGPRLKLFQCGLPYEMAVELFQPFLLRHMLELQLAKTIRAAKNILRFNKPLARQLLHHVVQAHPILLNRAPTLHRLGIQAFQPVLVFGRAIHLHPLVCPAFNADFDGDQMAVHIPLSPQARIEARLLMLASGNWLSSSTGQPNVLPSQDMVLGFYYLTIEKYAYQKGRGLFFNSLTDVMQAYEIGSIDLHSQIWLKWYGPFTGDSTSRFTSPQKHNKLGAFDRTSWIRPQSKVGWRDSPHSPGPKGPAPLGTKVEDVHQQGQIEVGPALTKAGLLSKNVKGVPGAMTQALLSSRLSFPQDAVEKHFKNGIYRFQRDTDQPIEIRLNKNGISTKIYSSYQWQQDSEENHRVSYIRTTPGRVLMNQIFQRFS